MRHPIPPRLLFIARHEKHYQLLVHRLAPHFIRESFVAFRAQALRASIAAAELGVGRTCFDQLYAEYLRACAARRERS